MWCEGWKRVTPERESSCQIPGRQSRAPALFRAKLPAVFCRPGRVSVVVFRSGTPRLSKPTRRSRLSGVGVPVGVCAAGCRAAAATWFVGEQEFRSCTSAAPTPTVSPIFPSEQIFLWYVLQMLRVQNSAWPALSTDLYCRL